MCGDSKHKLIFTDLFYYKLFLTTQVRLFLFVNLLSLIRKWDNFGEFTIPEINTEI